MDRSYYAFLIGYCYDDRLVDLSITSSDCYELAMYIADSFKEFCARNSWKENLDSFETYCDEVINFKAMWDDFRRM